MVPGALGNGGVSCEMPGPGGVLRLFLDNPLGGKILFVPLKQTL